LRYFVHVGYHGANYSGWQKHAGVVSVQQVLETALIQVLKTTIAIVGCGRTDAGVHASQFFFHMDVEKLWDFDLLFRLNKLLPDDIAVFDIIAMDGLPHARFDAIQRSYDYFIHTYKDPFFSGFSSLYAEKDFDLGNMKTAVTLLSRYNDYRAFCTSPDKNEHTICNVSTATLLTSANGDRLRFHISANRFLGKMIRIIVGRLISIGTGKMSVDEFESFLIKPQSHSEITPAYPQGLYLSKVTYPYLDIEPRTAFNAMLQTNFETNWQPV
jgi:tRNA pseudouridine38-40 synthase